MTKLTCPVLGLHQNKILSFTGVLACPGISNVIDTLFFKEMTFPGSLRLLKMEWTDSYKNPKTTEFQTLAGKVQASVGKFFN